MGLIISGEDKSHDEEVLKLYRKYLGPDHTPGDFFTTAIANHISYVDIFYIQRKIAGSYIAKDSVNKIPLVGYIAQAVHSVYLDRTSKENRMATVYIYIYIR